VNALPSTAGSIATCRRPEAVASAIVSGLSTIAARSTSDSSNRRIAHDTNPCPWKSRMSPGLSETSFSNG
jgi:hypothetical protein